MTIDLKPTGRRSIDGIAEREWVEVRVGAVSLGRIVGSRVVSGNGRIVSCSPLEGIQELSGCSKEEAVDALNRYSQSIVAGGRK